MKSPFPGMDPYLEWHWGDVHTSLTTYARDQLASQLPSDLRVRVEEYVGVDEEDGPGVAFRPEVRVEERSGAKLAMEDCGRVETCGCTSGR